MKQLKIIKNLLLSYKNIKLDKKMISKTWASRPINKIFKSRYKITRNYTNNNYKN